MKNTVYGNHPARPHPDYPIEKFASKIVRDGECWLWRGKVSYGTISFGGSHFKAHVWSYREFNGPVPDGYVVDHLCERPSCVNPDHLEAVTQSENIKRWHESRKKKKSRISSDKF